MIWQYIIIIIILVIVAIAIMKAKKMDSKMDANKLVECLGGKANIIDYQVNASRFVVNLHNIDLVNKEDIQKMGAQGIVEIDGTIDMLKYQPEKKNILKRLFK